MKIDLEQIRELLTVVSTTDITELTIEFGDQRITVKKSPSSVTQIVAEVPAPAAVVQHSRPAVQPAPTPVEKQHDFAPERVVEEPAPTANNGVVAITSPMVGTFYTAPSPNAAPFVNVGDRVAVGQTVCIIEAMKLMNDMPAEVSGKIVKVCVDNGTTVEYGQHLFLVDTKS